MLPQGYAVFRSVNEGFVFDRAEVRTQHLIANLRSMPFYYESPKATRLLRSPHSAQSAFEEVPSLNYNLGLENRLNETRPSQDNPREAKSC